MSTPTPAAKNDSAAAAAASGSKKRKASDDASADVPKKKKNSTAAAAARGEAKADANAELSPDDLAYGPRDIRTGKPMRDPDTGDIIRGKRPDGVPQDLLTKMYAANSDVYDIINSLQPEHGPLRHITASLGVNGTSTFMNAGIGAKKPGKDNNVTTSVTGRLHFVQNDAAGSGTAVHFNPGMPHKGTVKQAALLDSTVSVTVDVQPDSLPMHLSEFRDAHPDALSSLRKFSAGNALIWMVFLVRSFQAVGARLKRDDNSSDMVSRMGFYSVFIDNNESLFTSTFPDVPYDVTVAEIALWVVVNSGKKCTKFKSLEAHARMTADELTEQYAKDEDARDKLAIAGAAEGDAEDGNVLAGALDARMLAAVMSGAADSSPNIDSKGYATRISVGQKLFLNDVTGSNKPETRGEPIHKTWFADAVPPLSSELDGKRYNPMTVICNGRKISNLADLAKPVSDSREDCQQMTLYEWIQACPLKSGMYVTVSGLIYKASSNESGVRTMIAPGYRAATITIHGYYDEELDTYTPAKDLFPPAAAIKEAGETREGAAENKEEAMDN